MPEGPGNGLIIKQKKIHSFQLCDDITRIFNAEVQEIFLRSFDDGKNEGLLLDQIIDEFCTRTTGACQDVEIPSLKRGKGKNSGRKGDKDEL